MLSSPQEISMLNLPNSVDNIFPMEFILIFITEIKHVLMTIRYIKVNKNIDILISWKVLFLDENKDGEKFFSLFRT